MSGGASASPLTLMTLITSQTISVRGGTVADKRIAARDIIRRNERGMNVVLVPKGMPIPDDFDDLQDGDVLGASKPAKKKAAPAENKTRKS